MSRQVPGSLLAIGALAGAAAAAIGIAGGGRDPAVPGDAVAVVDGTAIAAADYRRALEAVAADRRDGLDDDDRRRVLERLIDEELLVQRGLELRLAERDPRVRSYLSAAVIDLIVARADDAAAEPGELALRALYAADPGYFAPPPRLRVQRLSFGDEARARDAAARLAAGASFAELRAVADDPPAPLPDALLPPAKLREYLGPTVVAALRDVPAGEVSAPIRSVGGYHVVRVVDRAGGAPPPFERARELVRREYRRRAGDARLRAFLAERRADAEIAIAKERL